jgi:hypothetical protein
MRSICAASPAPTKVFIALRSSGVCAGFVEKNRIQPASPQNKATNPRSSKRRASTESSAEPMYSTSSSERNMSGNFWNRLTDGAM